ncbi:MAG: efflux RND transporter periplasmic adaptor subunit [bacterium]
MKLKYQKLIILGSFIIIAVFAAACGGEDVEKTKSMAQLQNEEGVPVKVKKLEHETFEQGISFYATLAGYKESIQGAMIGDRVDKILVSVGSYVEQNQVVVKFPTDNAELMYEQVKAGFENTEKTYLRTKSLYEAGETSLANFEGIETKYKVEKRNVTAIEKALFIQSPISGKIVEIFVKEGTSVKSETPLFKVAQTDRIRAKIFASQDEVNKLKLGMPASIEYGGSTFKGSVSEISLSMDEMRRAFAVEVLFNNPQQKLNSGVTVDVNVNTYSKQNAIVLERNFIGKEGNKKFVFVTNDGLAEKKYITTGEENGICVEVLSSLKQGEILVTEGVSKLEQGKKVKVIN